MAAVLTRDIIKTFGEVSAVNGITLTVPDGEFMVLLGPSGCGKTTFLRIVCGLERQTSGDLIIGGDVVNDMPPRARGVAMMLQSYGLYPHYTVGKNIAFPLRTQRVPGAEIAKKVAWASRLLGIDHLLDRRPRQLSGGERQRVALARALVREPTARSCCCDVSRAQDRASLDYPALGGADRARQRRLGMDVRFALQRDQLDADRGRYHRPFAGAELAR